MVNCLLRCRGLIGFLHCLLWKSIDFDTSAHRFNAWRVENGSSLNTWNSWSIRKLTITQFTCLNSLGMVETRSLIHQYSLCGIITECSSAHQTPTMIWMPMDSARCSIRPDGGFMTAGGPASPVSTVQRTFRGTPWTTSSTRPEDGYDHLEWWSEATIPEAM